MAANVVEFIPNNVEEHKRVSFGGEKQIVYDNSFINIYSSSPNYISKHDSSFTATDAPPNKVTVTSENCEIPKPIAPPAQLEEHNPVYIAVSPVLPSLAKKMENESTENPFRPDETLYQEVDPIVKAYRQRPFPPSPCGSPPSNSPVFGMKPYVNGYTSTPLLQNEYHQTNYKEDFNDSQPNDYNTSITTTTVFDSSSPVKTTTIVTKKPKLAERTPSLAEARSLKDPTNSSNTSLIKKDDVDNIPPPHKAEIVHIKEKKKKCLCCSVQ